MDSEIALAWIRGKERSWKVGSRKVVGVTIRKKVDGACWKYVKSAENPADIN